MCFVRRGKVKKAIGATAIGEEAFSNFHDLKGLFFINWLFWFNVKEIMMNSYKLDNPAWYSLSETHKDLAIDYNSIKFYNPVYFPFGGAYNDQPIALSIAAYASFTDQFFVIGDEPEIDDKVKIEGEPVCDQIILYKLIAIHSTENIVELRTVEQRD